MRKEMRVKSVEYPVYIAEDGVEFENKKDCLFHDRLVRGEVKMCEECKGTGEILEEYIEDNYHTGAPELCTRHINCKCCNGKGYLEKKIVWE